MRLFLFFILVVITANKVTAQSLNLDWATSFVQTTGSSYQLDCASITTDAAGNVYAAGDFRSTVDMDPSAGVTNITSQGATDFYVVKYNPSGILLWVKTLGSVDFDFVHDLTVDQTGNVYLTGYFQNWVDFDPGPGVISLPSLGANDAFLLKLNTNGDYVWAKTIGGTSNEEGYSVILDDSDNIYLSGIFDNTVDFDPGAGEAFLTASGYITFILKLDPSGNFVWVRNLVSSGTNVPITQNIDESGNLHVVGKFTGTADFDPGIGQALRSSNGGYDVYLLKMDASGSLIWNYSYGSTGDENGNSIEIDPSGNLFVAGSFSNTIDLNAGAGTNLFVSNGSEDAFLMKLDPAGNYIWGRSLGGANDETAKAYVDIAGNIILTVIYELTVDFDPGIGISNQTSAGSRDFCVEKFDSDGNMLWIHSFGGSQIDQIESVVLNTSGDLFCSGMFGSSSLDVDPTNNNYVLVSTSPAAAFVMKLGQDLCSDFGLVYDSVAPVTCAGDGSTAVHGINGSEPYTYSWNGNPFSADSTQQFLSSGIQTITIKDVYNCVRTSSVLIDGPSNVNGFDLNTNLVGGQFRTGFPATVWLDAFNNGCIPTTGEIALVLDPQVDFNSASIVPDQIIGDTLFWFFDGLTYDSLHITPTVYLTIDPSATIGDSICFEVITTPVGGDVNPANNLKHYCFPVINGYDPNDKQVFPKGECEPNFVSQNQLLTYTIRFQNTGNAEAINIVLDDSLSPFLDINSLRVIGKSYSHLYSEILQGNVVRFHLDSIQLPDSTTNEPLSHGYVIYEISPLPSLPNNTEIRNKARIYFDFNPAVVTNEVLNTILDHDPNVTGDTLLATAADAFLWEGTTYSESGVYTAHYSTPELCDSSIFLNLTITHNSYSTIMVSACDAWQSPSGEQIWTISGTYTDTIANAYGADSIITVNLAITTLNTNTSLIDELNISSLETNATSYQWLDCIDGFSVIQGANTSIFTASANGNYAVEVTANGCVDTSDCVSIVSVGVHSFDDLRLVNVSPNPTTGSLQVEIQQPFQSASWKLTQLSGSVLQTGNSSLFNFELFIEGNPGMYFLWLELDSGEVMRVPIIRL